MLDSLIENDSSRLVIQLDKKIAPEDLEKACIEAAEFLGYGFQVHRPNGALKKNRMVTFNIPYVSWPFQIMISEKTNEKNEILKTDRIEVWTGRVYNERVFSKLAEYGSKVAEIIDKQH